MGQAQRPPRASAEVRARRAAAFGWMGPEMEDSPSAPVRRLGRLRPVLAKEFYLGPRGQDNSVAEAATELIDLLDSTVADVNRRSCQDSRGRRGPGLGVPRSGM